MIKTCEENFKKFLAKVLRKSFVEEIRFKPILKSRYDFSKYMVQVFNIIQIGYHLYKFILAMLFQTP